LAFAVLAGDRCPRLTARAGRRFEQHPFEFREVRGGCGGESRSHLRGRDGGVAVAVSNGPLRRFRLRLDRDVCERGVLSPMAHVLPGSNGVRADIGCETIVIRAELTLKGHGAAAFATTQMRGTASALGHAPMVTDRADRHALARACARAREKGPRATRSRGVARRPRLRRDARGGGRPATRPCRRR
jgi:hypothetical protein